MFSVTRKRSLVTSAIVFLLALGSPFAKGQDRRTSNTAGGGVFVTPLAGAPFSGAVEQQLTQVLGDGTVFERKTEAFVARDSRGRIHNENREILPASSTRKPALLSLHIYDPETRLNTFLNPRTHLARQRVLPNPPSTVPPADWAQRPGIHRSGPNLREEDLGVRSVDGIDVHGYRRTMVLPEEANGTGRPLVVTEEYWYSDELRINIVTRHNDPRFGQLTIVVKRIDRSEPSYDLFEIPASYKVVDMTPPAGESEEQ